MANKEFALLIWCSNLLYASNFLISCRLLARCFPPLMAS
uniref:Uncharacterized protein n=1 Tax=Arundo donax TaxID=35708 RepID=A0A0A9FTT8_ARUDO